MFFHSGILRYSRPDSAFRLVLEINSQLAEYYSTLAPKYWKLNPTRFDTHATIVRVHKEIPSNLLAWGKYEGQKVDFFYEPGLHRSSNYCWLRAVSKRFEEIRTELGLSNQRSPDPTHASFAIPPEGFSKYFHVTIGNFKVQNV